jgi:hypothetical protein
VGARVAGIGRETRQGPALHLIGRPSGALHAGDLRLRKSVECAIVRNLRGVRSPDENRRVLTRPHGHGDPPRRWMPLAVSAE